jgi:hypothetical protein
VKSRSESRRRKIWLDPCADGAGTRVANQTDDGAQWRKAVSWDHGKFAARAFGSDAYSVKKIYDKSIKAFFFKGVSGGISVKPVCRVRSLHVEGSA